MSVDQGKHMSKVFISYSRDDATGSIESLVDALSRGGGHEVFHDRSIAPGQAWWDTILGWIRDCDMFLFVLSEDSLQSEPCKAEREYAQALEKVTVPVVIGSQRPPNVPEKLGTIMEIHFEPDDNASMLELIEKMRGVPTSPPVREPWPPAPEVPAQYLDNVLAPLEQDAVPLAEQQVIVAELKARLKHATQEDKKTDDLQDAFKRLHSHPDVRGSVRDEVEEILALVPADKPPKPKPKPKKETAPTPTAPAKTAAAKGDSESKGFFYYVGVGVVVLIVLGIINGECSGYAF